MSLNSSNPFVRLENYQGTSRRLPPVTATSAQLLESSKLLANEVRRDDANMSKELAVLAPRSNRFYRLQEKMKKAASGSTTESAAVGMGLRSASGQRKRSIDAVASVEINEKITMDEFIAKKREVGLVHMSLATKRTEIRKLEEEIDCAEKKLHQQQEQLENTHEKFNNFLKHSNLEQDAAVRRADAETKAKQSKKVEIKKLSARINHVELEIRKAELQVETCKMYKKFLDDLTKPRWFFDVLIDLRVADKMNEILMLTETEFEQKSSILRQRYEKEASYREERMRVLTESTVKGGGRSSFEGDVEEQEIVPLSLQLEQLHDTLEKQVQEEVKEVKEKIQAEVNALTVEEVRDILERDYDESRKPTYYTNVEQLLDIFINVEEGNLFLIQNCQELEEELERVASEYMAEKNETMVMTRQRHAQMSALAEKIRGAQTKLRQLDDRTSDIEKHVPSKSGTAEGSGKNNNSSGVGNRKDPKNTNANNDNGGSSGVKLTPEQFKVEVEHIITRIFRTLTSGDALIKSLYASVVSQTSSTMSNGILNQGMGKHHRDHEVPFSMDSLGQHGEHEFSHSRRGSSFGGSNNGEGGLIGVGNGSGGGSGGLANKKKANGPSGSQGKDHGRVKKSDMKGGFRGHSHSPPNAAQRSGSSKKKKGKDDNNGNSLNGPDGGAAVTTTTAANGGHHSHSDQGAGSNMGPVEMLTIIENKLEEYHRTISDGRNGVEEGLIQQVMKASDKERRRQARLVHMAKQAQDQEERSRRALERSQAPIVRCIGKPFLPRSRLPKDSPTRKKRKSMVRGGSTTDIDSEFNEFL